MFGRLGAPEIILILLVVLLFGAKRLPDMARSFGQSLRILKSETKAMQKDDSDEPSTEHTAAALQTASQNRQTARAAAEAETSPNR
ncbi:Sec-independent protein translocase subunit TatA [Streptomyces sp. NBC_01571]|uniref:Sec-independent protein translocase subunit TatA n=1 Tax=Streptomyces sp. NBC_01571 TaxID=2975883 RepID=UPI00224DA498|nr:Sec-independent protein translocase subunit TatA [Streptomyces sp. NBC_01571]MCX4571882.1 Sec-independent protein translocase subunit TatA [Streptomyces sp. NBC_01571]